MPSCGLCMSSLRRGLVDFKDCGTKRSLYASHANAVARASLDATQAR